MPYIVYRTVVDIFIAIGLFPLLLDLCLDPSKYGIDKSFRTPFVDAQDSSDYIFVLFIVLEFLFIGEYLPKACTMYIHFFQPSRAFLCICFPNAMKLFPSFHRVSFISRYYALPLLTSRSTR